MLGAVDITKPSLSQHLSKFELLKKGQLPLFIEDLVSFGLFDSDVAVRWGKWLEGIVVITNILVDLKG